MAKTYEPIMTQTLSSATSSVSISNIPQTFTDLVLICSNMLHQSDTTAPDTRVRVNGNSSNIYYATSVYGSGSSASSYRLLASYLAAANTSTGGPVMYEINFMSYSKTTNYKGVLISAGQNSAAYGTAIYKNAGLIYATNAITSIQISPSVGNFAAGCSFALYGIKAKSPVVPLLSEGTIGATTASINIDNYDAGLTYTATSTAGTATVSTNTVNITELTPDTNVDITVTATNGANSSSSNIISITTGPVATGGTVTEAGGYRNHTFTSSGTFTLNDNKSVEYLVVAGGGGGVYDGGGGGGAGGMLTSTGTNLTAGSYAITVGGGGATNVNGSDSSIGSAVISIGGGGRGSPSYNGAPGGSGGGGKFDGVGGSATPGQGNSGSPGRGAFGSNLGSGAGGGGKGAAGEKVTAAGGSGELWNGVYYAGGGGGGGGYAGGAGSGGQGGGGAGGNPISVGSNGTTNTGGGAGGGGVNQNGGTGGSGIVIIRYPV